MSNAESRLRILPRTARPARLDVMAGAAERLLDSPMWLVAIWPLWALFGNVFEASADLGALTSVAAFVAGRRWGSAATLPVALACMPFVVWVATPQTGTLTPGDVWDIAAISLAFRFGLHPDLPRSLTSRPWTGPDHAALWACLAAGAVIVTAFAGQGGQGVMPITVSLHPLGHFLVVLGVILGLSDVRWRILLPPLVTVALVFSLTGMFWPVPRGWGAYIEAVPAMSATAALRFAALIWLVRQLRGLPDNRFFTIGGLVLLLCSVAYLTGVQVRIPLADFYDSALSGQLLAPILSPVNTPLVHPAYLMLLTGALTLAALPLVAGRMNGNGLLVRLVPVLAGVFACTGLWFLIGATQTGWFVLWQSPVYLPSNDLPWGLVLSQPPDIFASWLKQVITGAALGALVWAWTGQIAPQAQTLNGKAWTRRSGFVAVIGWPWAALAMMSTVFCVIYLGVAFQSRLASDPGRIVQVNTAGPSQSDTPNPPAVAEPSSPATTFRQLELEIDALVAEFDALIGQFREERANGVAPLVAGGVRFDPRFVSLETRIDTVLAAGEIAVLENDRSVPAGQMRAQLDKLRANTQTRIESLYASAAVLDTGPSPTIAQNTAQQAEPAPVLPNDPGLNIPSVGVVTPSDKPLDPFAGVPELTAAGLVVLDGTTIDAGDNVVQLGALNGFTSLSALEGAALEYVEAVPALRDSGAFFIRNASASEGAKEQRFFLFYGRFDTPADAQRFCNAVPFLCYVGARN